MTLKDLLEDKLSSLVKEHPGLPYGHLFTAARYSLFSGAKRIRPLLLIKTAQVYKIPIEVALQPACAIECIHTYSLIHDDLPCMDNDDLRRGQPTLHKVYPENHALLTGDYLLTFAFDLIASSPEISDTQKVALIKILSKRIGAHGMVGGQVADITLTKETLNWDTLTLIHHYKTAALMTAALECGAILGGASSSEMQIWDEIGMAVGFGFQLIDDILDGKHCEEKISALSFLTPEKCEEIAFSHLKRAGELLSSLPHNTEPLLELFNQMILRSY